LTKAEVYDLGNKIDRTVALMMASYSKEMLKKFDTKAAKVDYIISSDSELTEAQDRLDELKKDLICLDGVDKSIYELIATIKRELTRRENEFYHTKAEYK
jgi:hypothetical protein